jgi:hypothetical protein
MSIYRDHLDLQAKLTTDTIVTLSSNTPPQSQPHPRLRLRLNSFILTAVIGLVKPSAT